ncbi:MAG: peptidylprolyl isomerase [Pseudomonadota bacterium]
MSAQKYLLLATLAAALPAFANETPAPASTTEAQAPAAPMKITVNGITIPTLHNEIVRSDLLQRRRPGTDRHVAEVLVDNELLAQEAIKQGLDKPAEVQALLDLQRKDLLGKVLIERFIKTHPISEERAKAEYEQIKANSGDTEYHARHILVEDEKLARDLIKQLRGKKPPKFEDLAKKHSKDPGSAKDGGNLGWMAPASFVPDFAKAMVAMKKGELSKEPVKTQFGWHIIKLEDQRKIDYPEFDKVKERIGKQLIQQDVRKYLNELRSTAKIDVSNLK